MRKYCVVPTLNRVCTKEYHIPGTEIVLEKGTSIMIPSFSLQRDPKYYPNPDEFDPSRFFAENKKGKTIVDMPFLAFGDGPRSCIGTRMGKVSSKAGIVSILQKYNVELGEQHIGNELKFGAAALVLVPASGINLKFKSRNLSS